MSDKESITLLAIETSCDETGIAVVQTPPNSFLSGGKIAVLADAVASQVDIHKETGGVVPEIAAREHVSVLRPMLEKVLKEAGVTSEDLDGIAVTVGPGLMPALAVGVQAARTLAFAWGLPVVPIHHIEGHIYSALLLCSRAEISNFQFPISNFFPALALVVSGGHTMLVRMTGHLQYNVLGSTRDDAAGEAFDKVARILGLPYPGGPYVSKLAEKGDASTIPFPVPMTDSGDLDFSFSGLKTAVLYKTRELSEKQLKIQRANIAAGFQHAVVESLVSKLNEALRDSSYRAVLLAGGVAANELLRQRFLALADARGIQACIAPVSLCSDNAVMIGMAGLFAYRAGRTAAWQDIDAHARINIEEFSIVERRQ